jgi:hypothetical protein
MKSRKARQKKRGGKGSPKGRTNRTRERKGTEYKP